MTHEKADLYHFSSTPRYLFDIARLIRAAGRPYVSTLLLGKRSDFSRWFRDRTKRILEQQCYSLMLEDAAAVVAITENERKSIIASYGVPKSKMVIVPHGVDEEFFAPTPDLWRSTHGASPFLLCVGAIQPRKNQLLLLKMANLIQAAVVLIGPILPDKDQYANRITQAMKLNQQWGGRWIPGLPSDSPLLISAYAACQGFVLLSEHETQPIAVLQAMAAKKPVLLNSAEYTKETPFDSVSLVSVKDAAITQNALQTIWKSQAKPTSLVDSFRWPNIARQLADLYSSVLDTPSQV